MIRLMVVVYFLAAIGLMLKGQTLQLLATVAIKNLLMWTVLMFYFAGKEREQGRNPDYGSAFVVCFLGGASNCAIDLALVHAIPFVVTWLYGLYQGLA